MKLVVVSGLSGSGKSVALHTLEDLGYYCIDNLPAGLLSVLAQELSLAPNPVENAAVGIDARNLPQALQQFTQMLDQLKQRGIRSEILFLTCETETLIKRFSETRRRHPLSNSGAALAEGWKGSAPCWSRWLSARTCSSTPARPTFTSCAIWYKAG